MGMMLDQDIGFVEAFVEETDQKIDPMQFSVVAFYADANGFECLADEAEWIVRKFYDDKENLIFETFTDQKTLEEYLAEHKVESAEHYKCPMNTVKPGSCECPKDAEDVQLKARKAKDTGIQVRMVAENSYKPARTYTLNNISIDEFTMDESKQRYPIKDISKVVTSMPDKISSTIKKIEVHEGPSPMTEEISKKLGVQATIDADAEYTTGKIRIWNGSLDSGDDVDGMKLLQENLPHEAAHLVDRMTLSQSPDYAAAVESDGGWATGYAKDTAELDLKAGYGEDFADSVSEWVTARRSKADMGSHRLANRFKYFEEVLGQ